jgi:hypothetical protein
MPKQMLRSAADFYARHNLQRQEADRLLKERQRSLAKSTILTPVLASSIKAATQSLWNRSVAGVLDGSVQTKRGPKPDTESRAKVMAILRGYGSGWTNDDALSDICEQLDAAGVPCPKTWRNRRDGKSHSWVRGFENYPALVRKAIRDRVKSSSNGSEYT